MENEGDISFSGNNIAQFRLRLIVLFVCSVTRNLQYNMICYRITRTFRFASIDINNSKHKKQNDYPHNVQRELIRGFAPKTPLAFLP